MGTAQSTRRHRPAGQSQRWARTQSVRGPGQGSHTSSHVDVSVQPPFLRSGPGPRPPRATVPLCAPLCPSSALPQTRGSPKRPAAAGAPAVKGPRPGPRGTQTLHHFPGTGKRASQREKMQNPAWAGLKGRDARTGQCQAPRGWRRGMDEGMRGQLSFLFLVQMYTTAPPTWTEVQGNRVLF